MNSEENLKVLMTEFNTVCKKRKLKVNADKSKVMVYANAQRRERLNLSLNGEMLEEVESFKYLGSTIGKNGGVVEDVIGRVNDAAKVSDAMKRLWKVGFLGVNVKRMVYERIVLSS